MDPRYRALLVISLLLMFLWAAHVIWTVLLGSGVNPDTYMQGVALLGGSSFIGFGVVWCIAWLGNLRNNMKTGFEADIVDEFGTGFEMMGPDGKPAPFKLSLSKFLPQMVAPPSWPGLHPLEAELIGFLQGYRHWPVDLAAQNVNQHASSGREFASLYEQAVARWQVMRHLPGTGPLHRIIALSKDLALVHAYREVRTTHPLKQFWLRDKVRFVARCQPHGGLGAFVLSTFPAFREIKGTPEGDEAQKALLVAMRFHATPTLLPLNGGPLARELVDYLWRADAQLQHLDVREMDQLTPDHLEDLKADIATQWLTLLADMKPSATLEDSPASLKLSDGSIWMRQDALLNELAPLLKPHMRQMLGLWDTSANMAHPSWPHISNILLDLGFVANSHDGQAASNGCFTLMLGSQTWGPAMKLQTDPVKHASALRIWQDHSAMDVMPEVVMDAPQLAAQTRALAGNVEARLAELF
ncbi:MAG: hypothetical protein EON60_00960 [Alphaproteobacteria bacterium]|nr:MAG: hypothetical protein EON60_00960 [Alphaproteobacteria bacterium]